MLSVVTLCCPALASAQEAPAVTSAPALSTAPPAAAVPPDLLQRIDEIDQRSRIAERKLELADEEAAKKKKEGPTFSADEKGFGLSSADKQYEVKLRGLVQIDARRHFDTPSGDPTLPDRDTFLPRRIRPILDGTVLGLVDFRLMPDFGNGQAALLDGYLDAHPRPWLRLRAGKFKAPIGLERLQADQNVPFLERSLDANLSSTRDVGLQLYGDIANAALRYEIGIFNGTPDNGQNDLDNNHAKSYAGRLFLRPFQVGGRAVYFGDLGVGFAVMTGNEKGSATITNGAVTNTWLGPFRSGGQNTIFSYLASTTDMAQTVFALKRHTRLNPQLYYYLGGLGVLAEWVKEYQEVRKGAEDGAVNNQSGHVTVSYAFGGDNSYEGVKPRKAADWATKELGAVELAARFNWLDIDDAAFQGTGLANPATSVTGAKGFGLALSWWLNRNVRATGNWEQTYFQGGAGRAGAITDRPTEKILIARLQVAF
jgi:phosphate-selective porin OprO/OprP